MTSFARACAVDDVPDGGALRVTIGKTELAIVRTEGEIHAIDDICTHAEVSLADGDIADGEIECWLHGSRFDLRSGHPIQLPATEPVAVYPVKIDGDDVLVDVAHPENR